MPLGSPTVRVGAWKRVPLQLVDADKVRADLTLLPPKAGYGREETLIELFHESEEDPGAIYVPRNYRVEAPTSAKKLAFNEVHWPKDKVELRNDTQRAAFEALVAPPSKSLGRLLVLGCGKGKTVIGLKAGMARRVPIGVVVDLETLVTQWKERVVEHCGIPESDIGIVQGKRRDWEGKPITIMMVQTLMQRPSEEWPDDFRRYFGLAIYDEAHVLGARRFSWTAPIFYGERWALTATPDRHDGMDAILHYHFARKPCYVDVEQDLVPDVFFHHTGIPNPDKYIVPKAWTGAKSKVLSAGQVNGWEPEKLRRLMTAIDRTHLGPVTARFVLDALQARRKGSIPLTLSEVCGNGERQDAILRLIRSRENFGRTILVLGSRTEELKALHEKYTQRYGACGLCYGPTPPKQRSSQLRDYPVVFAAQNMVQKALDRPAFDALVVTAMNPQLATANNVQQSNGRIQRTLANKTSAETHYFVDEQSSLLRQTHIRLESNLKAAFGKKFRVRVVRRIGE